LKSESEIEKPSQGAKVRHELETRHKSQPDENSLSAKMSQNWLARLCVRAFIKLFFYLTVCI